MSVEELKERLIRLEAILKIILQRLDEIEKIFRDPSIQLIRTSVNTYSMTLKTFKDIATVYSYLSSSDVIKDEISRLIIQILASHESGLNISQITRRLRELRGRASRRIVRERLAKLVSMGIIEEVVGWGRVFRLIRGKYGDKNI